MSRSLGCQCSETTDKGINVEEETGKKEIEGTKFLEKLM